VDQGGSHGYHRFPAADWPASGQRQCIAGGAAQQQQQQEGLHEVTVVVICRCCRMSFVLRLSGMSLL